MNRKERIMAVLAGERPDRVPTAFWLPAAKEKDPARNAGAALALADAWDMDLIVTENAAGYSAEDYVAPSFTKNGGLAYITDPADWLSLAAPSVNGGALARELDTLRMTLEGAEGRAVLFRVTSPLATVYRLAAHIEEDVRRGGGDMVKAALRIVTETTCTLAQRAVELGADGILLAAPLADYGFFSERFYREYGAPYDRAVLSASQGWCNAVCGGTSAVMFPLLRKYPAEILAWDASQSFPTLPEAALSGKCAMAGLSRRHLEFGLRNETAHDIYEALSGSGGRLILSPGIPAFPRRGMEDFFRRAKQEIEEKV